MKAVPLLWVRGRSLFSKRPLLKNSHWHPTSLIKIWRMAWLKRLQVLYKKIHLAAKVSKPHQELKCISSYWVLSITKRSSSIWTPYPAKCKFMNLIQPLTIKIKTPFNYLLESYTKCKLLTTYLWFKTSQRELLNFGTLSCLNITSLLFQNIQTMPQHQP